MEILTGFALGVVASLVANYMSPPFARVSGNLLGWLFHFVNPDRFDLTGTWEYTFKEPDPIDPKSLREELECLRLRHLGSSVSGEGETKSEKRRFLYDLRIKHNLVFGSYEKVGEKGNTTGNGLIQLIVSPDRLAMDGQATWFDRDTLKIESAVVSIRKIS
ncbi:MAG: hypothetical protein ROZ64_06910 [Burkholderiaceae bacterium]|jgi:hypothetical protein|nr:hypothetical protein [Burkholderiaceae bacterium]